MNITRPSGPRDWNDSFLLFTGINWSASLLPATAGHFSEDGICTSSRFAWCGVRPRPVTYDKPRHAAKNDFVFGSNCLFKNVRHAPPYLAFISTVSGCDLRNTGKLDSGETL